MKWIKNQSLYYCAGGAQFDEELDGLSGEKFTQGAGMRSRSSDKKSAEEAGKKIEFPDNDQDMTLDEFFSENFGKGVSMFKEFLGDEQNAIPVVQMMVEKNEDVPLYRGQKKSQYDLKFFSRKVYGEEDSISAVVSKYTSDGYACLRSKVWDETREGYRSVGGGTTAGDTTSREDHGIPLGEGSYQGGGKDCQDEINELSRQDGGKLIEGKYTIEDFDSSSSSSEDGFQPLIDFSKIKQ